ncbi:MAG: leucine-rich repeat domain-containing protein [Promethearchaeota archaeon]
MSFVEYNGKKININTNVLYLNNKEIKDISDIKHLSNQVNLKELYLDGNIISEIKGLEDLVNLEVLGLQDNQITEISGLDNLRNLSFLNLYSNPILEIKALDNLVNLKDLRIGNCKINKLKGLDTLINLKNLEIEATEISEIENLENLCNLNTLFLGSNKITEMKDLDSLTKLQELDLENNKISIIQGLDNLINLESLKLFSNQISKIGGLDTLQNLKILSLDDNLITEIENLDKCESLVSLWLDKNKIKELKGLNNLKELENLGLSENFITEIKGLENLEYLQELNLESNEIKKIKSLDQLKQLKILNLSNNHIKELEGLENLVSLMDLDLHNNEFMGIDELIVRRGTSAEKIRIYCKRKKSKRLPKYTFYDETKKYEENLPAIENILNEIEEDEFIKIGTFEEQEEIREMQNLFFVDQKPEIKTLSKRDFNIKNLVIHLIQLHSLKGINFPKDNKIEYFLFFLSQFWDKQEINQTSCLSYKTLEPRINQKIEEMLNLSNSINNKKMKMIILPENTIPYNKIPRLIEFSKDNNLIIIGGLEHQKLENQDLFINKAIIIDNGIYDFQIKQTPVRISSKKLEKPIQESIKCEKIPKIRIFETCLGRIAIFICRDFLRLNEIISDWAFGNKVDFIVIPSLTSKILPFYSKLLNIFNQQVYPNLKIIFNNVGEYGGSELFSINQVKRIEEDFRTGIRDNVGEKIIKREIGEDVKEEFYSLFGKFINNWAKLEQSLRYIVKEKKLEREFRHYQFYRLFQLLYEKEMLHEFDYSQLKILREFRNRVVHGDLLPSEQELSRFNQLLDSILTNLRQNFNLNL